jgi:hypothetical protein
MASSGGAKQVIEGSPYRIGLAKKKVGECDPAPEHFAENETSLRPFKIYKLLVSKVSILYV